jgi:PAS domain S-box-containing protein
MDALHSPADGPCAPGREAERLALALRAAGFGEWEYDFASGTITASPRYRSLFGFSDHQPLSAAEVHERFHPEDRPRVEETLGALVGGEAPEAKGEYRILLHDGTVRWISFYGQVFRDESGMAVRAAGVVQDITDRKHAECALGQSEERFRVAVRAVAGLVYDWDLASGEAFRSEGLEDLIGIRPDQVPTEADWWSRRIHPEDQERLVLVRSAIRAGVVERFDASRA